MKRMFFTAFMAAALLIGFSSCDQGLFQTNIFAGYESFESPSADDADSLLVARDDDRFYEDIAGDGVDDPYVGLVITTLDGVINDPGSTTQEKQEASLMLADVYMAATGADEVFDEFNPTLNEYINDKLNGTVPDISIEGPEDIVELLFDTTADASTIKEQLTGLLLTAEALAFYGPTVDGDSNTADTPVDQNAGDIAAQALISGVIFSVIQATIDLGNTEDEALDILVAAILSDPNDPTGWSNVGTPVMTDTNGDGEVDITSILGGLADIVTEGLDLSKLGL